MKRQLLFGLALIVSAILSGDIFGQAAVGVDPATYTRRGTNGEMSLTSKWLYSNKLNNYNVAADFIAPANMARGMAVKDGKMLFINRNDKRIEVVNGATGARETPINLASNLFTYLGRNKANTADSIWSGVGTLQYNDIKVDNAGNVLISNLYEASLTSHLQRFQVWKINLTDGTGTVIVDDYLNRILPNATASTLRFDAFGVYGDVNTSAIIMAANAKGVSVFKWQVTNGVVVGDPQIIDLDTQKSTGKDLAELGSLGSAPQVFPLDETYFYVDGNATHPVLCDSEGNVVDGFKANFSALKDSVTAPFAEPKTIWTMGKGPNGIAEFQVGNKYYVVMASSNTDGTPASTFRLFQFADASKAFTGLTTLWTFPQAGMGNASNSYRTAMPAVEVVGDIAKIYVYYGENGYGMYEFNTAAPTSVNKFEESNITIKVFAKNVRFSEEIAKVEVINTAGQRVMSAVNVSELDLKMGNGVYIVNITDKTGARKMQKVVIQ